MFHVVSSSILHSRHHKTNYYRNVTLCCNPPDKSHRSLSDSCQHDNKPTCSYAKWTGVCLAKAERRLEPLHISRIRPKDLMPLVAGQWANDLI